MKPMETDEHLRAALRHAPDAGIAPPPHLSAQILAAAHRAVDERPPAPAAPPRRRGWMPGWTGWQLGGSGAFATVLMAGVVGLLWRNGTPPAVAPAAEAPAAVATVDEAPAAPAAALAPAPSPAPAAAAAMAEAVPAPAQQGVARDAAVGAPAPQTPVPRRATPQVPVLQHAEPQPPAPPAVNVQSARVPAAAPVPAPATAAAPAAAPATTAAPAAPPAAEQAMTKTAPIASPMAGLQAAPTPAPAVTSPLPAPSNVMPATPPQAPPPAERRATAAPASTDAAPPAASPAAPRAARASTGAGAVAGLGAGLGAGPGSGTAAAPGPREADAGMAVALPPDLQWRLDGRLHTAPPGWLMQLQIATRAQGAWQAAPGAVPQPGEQEVSWSGGGQVLGRLWLGRGRVLWCTPENHCEQAALSPQAARDLLGRLVPR